MCALVRYPVRSFVKCIARIPGVSERGERRFRYEDAHVRPSVRKDAEIKSFQLGVGGWLGLARERGWKRGQGGLKKRVSRSVCLLADFCTYPEVCTPCTLPYQRTSL